MKTLTPKEYERQFIEHVLEQTDWVIAGPKGAAARLEMPEATLRHRIKKTRLTEIDVRRVLNRLLR